MKCAVFTLIFCALAYAGLAQNDRGLNIKQTEEKQDTGATYALIVGISAYQYITPLKYADKDATLFKEYILSNAGGKAKEENILYLINDEAKGGTLNARALTWIENRKYAQGDKLYIYLAGHGDAIDEDEYFFLGSDLSTGSGSSKDNYTAGYTIQMFNLKTRIKKIVAKGVQVILIMDACRSNELAGGETGQKMFADGVIKYNAGEIMMLSAGPGQTAIESAEIGGGHGLFTWYLIDGLAGAADKEKKGKIELYDLMNYVKENVRSDAMKKFGGHKQSPDFSGFKDDSKIIASVDTDFYRKWERAKSLSAAINSGISLTKADNRQPGDNIDSVLIKTYNLFAGALKRNKLTGDSSAAWYYNTMEASYPSASLTGDARYTLAGEFLNYATTKINLILSGKDQTSQSQYQAAVNAGPSQNTLTGDNKYKLVATIPYKITADYIDRAMALLKDDTAMTRKLQTQYLYFLARSYYEPSHTITYDEAVKDIKTALKQQPSAAYLHLYLGILYTDGKNYRAAEKEINQSIALAPSWSYNYCSMGRLYYVQQKFPDAEIWYKKAIGLDSTFSEAYSNLGNLYLDVNRSGDAEQNYKMAIRFDSSESVTNSRRLYNLAVFYAQQNNTALAETYYRSALNADSTFSRAANNLGVILYHQNNFPEAGRYFETALRHDTALFNAYNNLGLVFDTLQNFKDEAICLKKAVELMPGDGIAYINLSDLYSRLQDTDKAMSCLETAIKRDVADAADACYNLACFYADRKDIKNSLRYLELSFKKGFSRKDNLTDDLTNGELTALKDLPELKALMNKYFPETKK